MPRLRNKDKIILDLCGGTGTWSKPYKDAGYDVRLVTLPREDVIYYLPPDNVYGILAAPPCTMFSFARTAAKTPRDFFQGMDVVRACLDIIWACRAQARLQFWALENPRGYLWQFLGRPAYQFTPSEFGHATNKKTCLWGYFNPPRKRRKKTRVPRDQWKMSKYLSRHRDAKTRSITPAGFARAFFQANP